MENGTASHTQRRFPNTNQLFAPRFRPLLEAVIVLTIQVTLSSCRIEFTDSQFYQQNPPPLHFTEAHIPQQTHTLTGEISVGAAKVSMSVPDNHPLAGYGGLHRRFLFPVQEGKQGKTFKPHTEVDSEAIPSIKVLIYSDEQANNIYIISVDAVAVSADFSLSLVETLNKKSPSLNINHSNTIVTATHTHSGPTGLSINPFWQPFASGYYDINFFNILSNITLQAVQQAKANQKKISSTSLKQSDLSDFIKNRTETTSLNTKGTSITFKTSEDEIAGCLLIIPLHPTHYGTRDTVLSADYAGLLENNYTKLINEQTSCIFLNGAGGNAAAKIEERTPGEYSEQLVQKLDEAEESNQTLNHLSLHSKIVSMGKPSFNLDACGAGSISAFVQTPILDVALPRKTLVQTMDLGSNITLRFFPGEITEDAWGLLKSSESEIPVSLSNDYAGYFVSKDHYRISSIESCSSLYGENGVLYLR